MSSSGHLACPQITAQLCLKCRSLDILSWRWQDRLRIARLDVPLGRVQDVRSRAWRCSFCHFLTTHGRLDDEDDESTLCEIVGNNLVFLALRSKSSLEGWITQSLHLDLVYRSSGDEDDGPMYGPYAPLQTSLENTRHPRTALELQYYCREKLHSAQTLSRLVENEVAFDVIRRWSKICSSSHQLCKQKTDATRGLTAIDIQFVDLQSMCLVHAPKDARYVALSYVWGNTTTQVKEALSSVDDLFSPGSLHGLDLPRTILDTFIAVRQLGERYLWIDALCIPMNDPEARALQIAQMATIYRGACFTIVAACGADANAGLPDVREGTRQSAQGRFNLNEDVALLTLIGDQDCPGARDAIWHTRAWTFQESVLSPRQLVWTEKQVYWECDQASWHEEYCLDNHSTDDRGLILQRSPPIRSDVFPLKDNRSHSFHRRYAQMRDALLTRNLTQPTDMLNAFAGVLDVLASENAMTFLFGVPVAQLTAGLLWSMPGKARNHTSVTMRSKRGQAAMVPFPSWSWCAWQIPRLPGNEATAYEYRIQPVLAFYRKAVDGRYAIVREDWEPDPRERLRFAPHVNPPWKTGLSEMADVEITEPDDEWIDSGLLSCWTSTSYAYIVSRAHYNRLAGIPAGDNVYGPDAELCEIRYTHSVSSEELAQADLAHILFVKDKPWPVYDPLRHEDDAIKKELMVIALEEHPSGRELVCLVFDRIDGIAYRVGLAWISEANWMAMERKWELMTLG